MRARICLAIETTGSHLGAALHDLNHPDFRCVARFFKPTPGRQSDLLFPTIDRLLKNARLKKPDLALVAVDHGPGSFTGVRVGVAAGRAIAQSLSLPIVGIGSLEALAWQVAEIAPDAREIAARIPALAGESYFAVFNRTATGSLSVQRKPEWTTDDIVATELKRVSARGAHLSFIERPKDTATWPAGLVLHPWAAPDPSAIAQLALMTCGQKPSMGRFDLEKTVPVYLQPSWAERSKRSGLSSRARS